MGGLLSNMVKEAVLKHITNHCINDISLFNNNERIIQCYNIPQYNITEEPRYISCMAPTRLFNGQYESRRYVNSSFQVLFYNIYFQTVIYEY